MSTRSLLNLALLAIAVALGLVAWLRPGIEPVPAPLQLTNLDPDKVNAIDIIRMGDQIGFRKRGDQWFVSGDPELPADPLQIRSLLRLASAEIRRHYPAGELDLAELELDPAPIRIIIDGTELWIGGTDPLENLRYVRSGDTVALVQDTFYTMLEGKRTNFASRRLLPEGVTIDKITLPEVTISRSPGGNWMLEPEQENVSADAIQSLVDGWTTAEALWVAETGTVPEDSKIVAVTLAGEETPLTWRFVTADNSISLTRADLGLKYEIGSGMGDRLLVLEKTAPDAGTAPPTK